MTKEEIDQKIQITHIKLSSEDNTGKIKNLQIELKKLELQKEIAVIKQKIEQLENM